MSGTDEKKCFSYRKKVPPVLPVGVSPGSGPNAASKHFNEFLVTCRRLPGFPCITFPHGETPGMHNELPHVIHVHLKHCTYVFLTTEKVLKIMDLAWTRVSRFFFQEAGVTAGMSVGSVP